MQWIRTPRMSVTGIRAALQKLERGEINKTKVLKVLCPKCLETQINSASEGLE